MGVGEQNAVSGAHRHFTAEDLFVFVEPHRDDADLAANFGDNLQGLFDRVVIRLIDRIDEVVAFDIVAGTVQFDVVLRSVRHAFDAD